MHRALTAKEERLIDFNTSYLEYLVSVNKIEFCGNCRIPLESTKAHLRIIGGIVCDVCYNIWQSVQTQHFIEANKTWANENDRRKNLRKQRE